MTRFRKRYLLFAFVFRFGSINLPRDNQSFSMNPMPEEQVRIIKNRDQVFPPVQVIRSFKLNSFTLFSLVPEYNETDISKIVAIRGGSNYLDLLKWVAKNIEKASPMLFLVMRESNGFVPPSTAVNSSPINSQSARPTPKVIDRTEGNTPTSRPKKSVCQAAEGSWQDTNDPNEYCPNRPSQESIVATEHLETSAIITDSDIKRIMTPQDRIIPKDRLDQTQKMNERFKRAEIGMRIANPEKVFGKVYRVKECKIFLTVDDDGTVRSSILNTKSGRLLIDTKLSDKEYASLQDDTSSRFDLTDLRRDVQTDVMNQKSLNEYDSMTRAVLQKQLPADFKRPEDPESGVDYVSSDGKTGYEIKRVTQNKYQTFEASANNIIRNIKAQHAATLDGYEKFIVDLVETAHDLETQKRIYQHINQELSNQDVPTDSLIYLFN
jgi:hypothetical protein